MTATVLFAGAALLGLAGLCTLVADEVPHVLGTLAIVLTLAALAAAIPH